MQYYQKKIATKNPGVVMIQVAEKKGAIGWKMNLSHGRLNE